MRGDGCHYRTNFQIACGGAWATEGRDRWSLDLDQDAFLRDLGDLAAAARNEAASPAGAVPPLVVAALAPGAFTAEWAEKSDGALVAFLTGQETGRARESKGYRQLPPARCTLER